MKTNEVRTTKRGSATRWAWMVPVVILLVTLLLPITRGESPLKLGVDLAGGVIVTYRPDFETSRAAAEGMPADVVLSLAKEALASRLQRKLNTIPEVVVRGDQRVVVTIPAVADHRAVLALVGKTYHLSLRLVSNPVEEPGEGVPRYPYQGRDLVLEEAVFTGDMLADGALRVVPGQDLSDPSAKVGFAFRPPHDEEFAQFTKTNRGRTMAIMLDEDVEWAGVIEGEIRGEGLLSGGYTAEEASDIVRMLRAGTLPVGLEVESLRAVGPGLGQAIQDGGVRALGWALAALVALVMIAYGHNRSLLVAGLVSLTTLLVFLLGLAALFGLTLDLVGIAGIVLSVGMGMDAFVIVFEALEARRRREGEAPPRHHQRMVRAIYSFAGEGATLFHANATTLVVIGLLLVTERLRSFALFIGVGILASVLTIFVTRAVLSSGRAFAATASGPLAGARRARPGVFRLRWLYAVMVIVLVVATGLGIGMSATRDGSGDASGVRRPMLTLGSDFRPGTQLEVSGPTSVERTRPMLDGAIDQLAAAHPTLTIRDQQVDGEPDRLTYLLTLDAVTDLATGGNSPPGTLQAETLLATFRDAGLVVEQLQTVDGRVSAARLAMSFSVLGLSFLMLAIYLRWFQGPLTRLVSRRWTRTSPPSTQWRLLLGMITAVLVDVTLVVTALAWLGVPFGLPEVAALLTVIGYSVNDSVVLWSHIDARWARLEDRCGGAVAAVVQRGVDAMLVRALITSLSTMVPAIAILAAGLEPLRGFAWAVLVGTAAGTLSSLFIVGTVAHQALTAETRRGRGAEVVSMQAAPGTSGG